MPSSNLALAWKVIEMAREVKPKRVLDIGPGNGKYGLLLREYIRGDLHITGCEAEARYLEMFPWLRVIYDEVWHADGTELTASELAEFDLVLMIDSLEHIARDVGEALLRRIPGRVIICTPRYWFQNPEADQGWETERHRSLWTPDEIRDIRPLEVFDVDAYEGVGGVLVRTGLL